MQTPPAQTFPGQTPDPNGDLLQPFLEGDPANPPRFQQRGDQSAAADDQTPPPGRFTAPNRIGATPTYGSATAFGAGNTGFNSRNERRKRPARTPPNGAATTFDPVPNYQPAQPPKPPKPKKPPPPEIYPKTSARRVGATVPAPPDEVPLSNPPPEIHPLSAANRVGAALAVPPAEYFDYFTERTEAPTLPPLNTFTLGTLPQRPLPFGANDPYAALGLRAGSFLLLPSVDLSTAYTTNAERLTGAAGSGFMVAAPELQVASDWERHSLTADIVGSWTQYFTEMVPSLNVPYVNSRIDGRIDVTRDTQILLESRLIVSSDNPGSPNLQAQVAQLPPNFDVGWTLGLNQQFNRLTFTLKGTFDRATYDNSILTDGERVTNDDRNFDQTAGILRIGYEIDPGLKPFIEAEVDERVHDDQYDRNDLQRDSVGSSVKVGGVVDLFGTLSGEMAAGYVERVYQDPTLPNIGGPILNGVLIWQATPLTTAKLTATSQISETTLDDASGEFSRDINLQVDHAFRTWLIGSLKFGYGTDRYTGTALNDTRYYTSAAVTYKFTREWQIRTELREDWMTATEPGFAYTATSLLFGVRWQR